MVGMKTMRSKKLFNQAKGVMVGGVNSPVRAFNAVGGMPLIMQRGQGKTETHGDFGYEQNAVLVSLEALFYLGNDFRSNIKKFAVAVNQTARSITAYRVPANVGRKISGHQR